MVAAVAKIMSNRDLVLAAAKIRAGLEDHFMGKLLGLPMGCDVCYTNHASADLQIVIGDGLSVSAVAAQVPPLLPLLDAGARQRGWQFGNPFVVRYCRVGVMNDIGDLLAPKVLVLFIGERPGMATAESLSAYLAYRPRAGHTDVDRNLISSIHSRGIPAEAAAIRILNLADGRKNQWCALKGIAR